MNGRYGANYITEDGRWKAEYSHHAQNAQFSHLSHPSHLSQYSHYRGIIYSINYSRYGRVSEAKKNPCKSIAEAEKRVFKLSDLLATSR